MVVGYIVGFVAQIVQEKLRRKWAIKVLHINILNPRLQEKTFAKSTKPAESPDVLLF